MKFRCEDFPAHIEPTSNKLEMVWGVGLFKLFNLRSQVTVSHCTFLDCCSSIDCGLNVALQRMYSGAHRPSVRILSTRPGNFEDSFPRRWWEGAPVVVEKMSRNTYNPKIQHSTSQGSFCEMMILFVAASQVGWRECILLIVLPFPFPLRKQTFKSMIFHLPPFWCVLLF